MRPTRRQLLRLREDCRRVAAADTCYPPEADDWPHSDDPLHGHCGCAALAVKQRFGGRIVSCLEDGVRWIFNELDDGRYVCLTRPGLGAPTSGRVTEVRLTNRRFSLFLERLEDT